MVGMFPFTHGILRGAGYVTGAVNFDGTNDVSARGADLTGSADAATWMFSMWILPASTLGGSAVAQRNLYFAEGGFGYVRLTTADNLLVHFESATSSTFCTFLSTGTISSTNGWSHIAFSCDGSSGALMLRGATNWTSTAFVSTAAPDFTRVNHLIGANSTAVVSPYTGDLADFWMHMSTYIDVRANIGNYISGGKPVDLGSSGAIPTGSQPIMFFKMAAGSSGSTFAVNIGSGGNFSITGALSESTSSPSD